MASAQPVMHQQNLQQNGNIHACVTVKRSIKRALRQYFLQGWTRYHGHLINSSDRLAAFFPRHDIEFVKAQINTKRTWWFERDMHFHLHRQDCAVLLTAPTRRPLRTRAGQKSVALLCLKLLNFNCQSLGQQSTRLQELCEDLHTKDIAIAAFQGTRWPSADPRSEWIVKSYSGSPRFACFSWGRTSSNRMLGVLLLVSTQLLADAFVHTRFDPPRGLQGRLGGVRLVSRQPGREMDELLLRAYAPQETDDLSTRQAVFQAMLEIIHSVPRRARVWLLGDFDGHVGAEFRSSAVKQIQPLFELLLGATVWFSSFEACALSACDFSCAHHVISCHFLPDFICFFCMGLRREASAGTSGRNPDASRVERSRKMAY